MIRVEPDAVVVAVGRRDGRERLAAVAGLEQAQRVDPDLFGVLWVDVHIVEIERTRAQVRRTVDDPPGRSAVVRAVKTSVLGRGLDHRVNDGWLAARNVDIDLADHGPRQTVRQLLPRFTTVDGLVDPPLAGGAAADDVPAFAKSL